MEQVGKKVLDTMKNIYMPSSFEGPSPEYVDDFRGKFGEFVDAMKNTYVSFDGPANGTKRANGKTKSGATLVSLENFDKLPVAKREEIWGKMKALLGDYISELPTAAQSAPTARS